MPGYIGSRVVTLSTTAADIDGDIVVSGVVDGRDLAADGSKLDGIEAGATADQTGAEIKTAYEAESDTNAFTDAEKSKLSGIEANATADQTGAEIKTAYEAESDTNAYTDAEKTKLAGIETGATADQTASEILTAIKTVDGATSGLDADLLDGQEGSYYTGYTDTAIANLADTAPSTLDTLNELAAALGDDPNFATTVTNSIATKLPLAGGTMTGAITFASGQTFDGRDVSADGSKLDGIESGATADQTASEILTSIKTVDGSGSGLDADLWDGNQFSSYLNQSVRNDASPIFSNINLADKLIHSGDTNTSLTFATDICAITTGGTDRIYVDNNGVRIGDTGNGYIRPVSGSYGSIEIDGGAHGGYEGYSIGGRVVFMHNSADAWGIYNDVNNQWAILGTLGGSTSLQYGGSTKIETTTTGATTSGTHTATNFNTTSDATLKTNVETLTGSLDAVKAMRGVSFDWIESGNSEVGVIAQEVEAVVPDVVSTDDQGIKSVKYGNIVAVLIEAIKEQQERIEALEAKLNS